MNTKPAISTLKLCYLNLMGITEDVPVAGYDTVCNNTILKVQHDIIVVDSKVKQIQELFEDEYLKCTHKQLKNKVQDILNI